MRARTIVNQVVCIAIVAMLYLPGSAHAQDNAPEVVSSYNDPGWLAEYNRLAAEVDACGAKYIPLLDDGVSDAYSIARAIAEGPCIGEVVVAKVRYYKPRNWPNDVLNSVVDEEMNSGDTYVIQVLEHRARMAAQ